MPEFSTGHQHPITKEVNKMSLDIGDIAGTIVGLGVAKEVKKSGILETGEPIVDLAVSLGIGYAAGSLVDNVLDGIFDSDD